MEVVWELPPRMLADQLSKRTRESLAHDVRVLATDWDRMSRNLKVLGRGRSGTIYSLRVGSDLRVILKVQGNTIFVVDLVRKNQIDKLRDVLRKQD